MSQNEEQEQELDQNPDEEQEDEDNKDNQPDPEALIGRLKREQTKREKLEQELQELRESKKDSKQNINSDTSQSDERYERLELKIEGYNDEEIEHIMNLGGRKSLETPLVKQGIQSLREQRKAEEATNVDGKTKSGKGQSQFTADEIHKMTKEEYIEKVLKPNVK